MIMRLRHLAALCCVTGVVAGCGASTTGAGSVSATADVTITSPAMSGSPRSPGERPTAPTAPTAPDTKPVTISFGGDVHFEDEIAWRLEENPSTTLGPIATVLRASDISMVNLETAITTGGNAAPKKYNFRAPPTALRALSAAGVDVATMANNHGMDYGLEGLRDSLVAASDSDLAVIGIGKNAERAYAPYTVTVHGQRLAFIGATQVLDSALIDDWTATADHPGLASAKTVDRLVRAVRSARRQADTVVVYVHWGRTMRRCPLDRQRELARALSHAGADVIVGGHAHRLLAGGFLGETYVDYGLGNFVWYNAGGIRGRTGVLTLTVRDGDVLKAKWTPAAISGGVPDVLTGEAADDALDQWRSLRDCTDLTAEPRP